MVSVSKRFSVIAFFLLFGLPAFAQVNINFSISPPFTPFISDYIQPQRLDDINVSLFNTTNATQRLKFKISLTNQSKGISVVLKDNVSPVTPIILNPNELLFLTLSDVGTNYGKLDQTSFTAVGINIQSAVLDGTLPDGLYEICIQAFDFDAVGFTKPISNGSPTGCFSFNVNYTDPPTDIRFNGNLINYTYRGIVPYQGYNKTAGQNFVINFTPPTFNSGSDYLYTLYVFDESMVNPFVQQEAQILQAINTLVPTLTKTSNIPNFFIDASDPILDENKNYYLVIKAEDLNSKTVFKNKGFSTMKAFNLFDNSPRNFGQLQLIFPNASGTRLDDVQSLNTIKWDFQGMLGINRNEVPDVITRVKVVMVSPLLIVNSSIMNTNIGVVILDTSFAGDPNTVRLIGEKSIAHKFKKMTDTLDKKFIFSVQMSLKNGSRFQGVFNFPNNGLPLNNTEFITNPASSSSIMASNSTVPVVTYPVDNDTLPFQYIPVVVQMPVTSNTKIAFSQFDSDLEPLESFKYLKLTTDVNINNQLNSLSLDSSLKKISQLLNSSADLMLRGQDIKGNDLLEQAKALILKNSRKSKVELNHALNMKQLPLGNSAKGKYAVARAAINYEALIQLMGSPITNLGFPNLEKMIYVQPYKNNVMWMGKVGLYDVAKNGGMSLSAYETKFVNQSFTKTEQSIPMVKNTFRTFSGSYNVGMRKPVLTPTRGMLALPGKVTVSFIPSAQPQKIFPTPEQNNAWYEFDSLFVAQQWNLEVSRKKNFSKLDTVISRRIIRHYNVAAGTGPVIRDLYSKVNLQISLRDTGTYYWRVTWSNITLDTQNKAAQSDYWIQLCNKLADAQLLGQMNSFLSDRDSFFFQRKNYRFSAVDSIKIRVPAPSKPAPVKPTFDVIYPQAGDTIPFQFPPVVFQNRTVDNADKFLLSRFDSDLEPLPISRYYITQKHPSSDTLKTISYDSIAKIVRKELDLLAMQELTGTDPTVELVTILQNAENRLGKKGLLQIIDSVYGMSAVPLGNNDTFKFKLISQYLDRVANLQLLGSSLPFDQNGIGVGKMLYLEPFKTVNWNSQFAFYNTTKNSGMSVKSFEEQFANNPSFASTSSVSGNFNVGMKRPEIMTFLNGKNIPINKLSVHFRPSKEPSRLIPNFESNKAWFQFQKLLVAQQWNIEVSQSPTFDSIIYRKSKKIVEFYSLPGSVEQMRNDLYNQRNEKIELKTKGKHYYRITWSNPVNLSTKGGTNDSLYLRYYINALASSELLNDNSELTQAGFKALTVLKNYQFSVIDSFNVTDSVKIDTAVCGQDCNFDMAGISLTPAANHIARNDVVKVGKFDMTVTEISFSGNNASGKGFIRVKLLGKKVKVEFSGVQFNAEKRLISGTIKAEIAQNTAMNEVVGVTTSGFTVFDKLKVSLKDSLKASKFYDYINSPLALVSELLSDDPVTLPLGLSHEVDNFPSTIAFTDMVFTPTRANINAAAVIRWSYGNKVQFLGFTGSDFCMNENGLASLTNGATLELVGDIPIQINDSLLIKIVGKQNLNSNIHTTRIEWDCKGLKDIALVASVTLPRSVFVPVENNKRTSGGQVSGIAEVHISSIQNFLLSFSFDKSFEFNPLPGFTFTAQTVSLDMSDYVNPTGIEFPAGFNGERSNAWRGIYVGLAEIKLPEAFANKNSPGIRLALNTRNLLIDPSGFTANVGLDNILAIEDGEVAGWKFSINRVAIDIVSSSFRTCALTGKFGVPVFTGEIDYSLAISPNLNKDSTKMNFSLAPSEELGMDAWFARVALDNSSIIKLEGALSDPNSWKVTGNFNGNVSLAGDMAGVKNVRLGTLPFEGLLISTAINNPESFTLSLEKLGGLNMNRMISESPDVEAVNAEEKEEPAKKAETLDSEDQGFAGFPIGISDFGMDLTTGDITFQVPEAKSKIKIGLKFKLLLNLTEGDEGNGIAASCGLGLYGYLSDLSDVFSFRPAGLSVDTIKIDAKLAGVATVRGAILFLANDPVFGNGFMGMITANFEPAFEVNVSAIFGQVKDMRYFMVDGQLDLPNAPIPIDFSVGVLYANSFGGGLWYKMKMTPGTAADAAANLQLGKSYSGNSFEPDESQLIGFEARLGLTGPPGTPLFGMVTLGAEIAADFSLETIYFVGDIWLTQPKKSEASVFARGRVVIDLGRKRLTGDLSALVNVANGAVRGRIPLVTGGKTFYMAGNVSLLADFNKSEYYIKLGDPYVPNGKLGFGFYAGNLNLFEAGGYFMIGNKLNTNLPPMSPDIRDGLERAGIYVPKTAGRSNTGTAIVMGLDAAIPEKRVELGMFFAGIRINFAVDGVLAPATLDCRSRSRNGIGGWYANATAYAVVNGALGLRVNTPFFKGDIIAGEVNAGALLDAGLLNPYVFSGQFAANYSVLGGLMEGSQTFNFLYQEDETCLPPITSTALNYGQIVSSFSPRTPGNSNPPADISVGADAVISLNFEINKPTKFDYPVVRTNARGQDTTTIETKFLRAKFENFSLAEISGTLPKTRKVNPVVSADGFDLILRTDSFLRPNRMHLVKVRIYMEESTDRKTWKRVEIRPGKNWDTLVTFRFTTEVNATLDPSVIAYSSPLQGERYFKIGDCRQIKGKKTGTIYTTKQDVKGTFFTPGLVYNGVLLQPDCKYYGQYSAPGLDSFRVDLTFGNTPSTSNEIRFELLPGILNEKMYQFRLIREKTPLLNQNSQVRLDNVNLQSGGSSSGVNTIPGQSKTNYQVLNEAAIRIRNRQAANSAEFRLILHLITFRTSKYNTLTEKINQLTIPDYLISMPVNDSNFVSLTTNEPFEKLEVNPYTSPTGALTLPAPLVFSSAAAGVTPSWFQNFYLPKIKYAHDSLRSRFVPASNFSQSVRNYLGNLPRLDTMRSGAGVVNDYHILGQHSILGTMDYKLACLQVPDLERNYNIEFDNVISAAALSDRLGFNTYTTIDPLTGMSIRLPIPGTNNQNSNNPPPPKPPPPPKAGTRLTVNYDNYRLTKAQFDYLKRLVSAIDNEQAMKKFAILNGFSQAQSRLYNRILGPNPPYEFIAPFDTDYFTIYGHVKSRSQPAVKSFAFTNLDRRTLVGQMVQIMNNSNNTTVLVFIGSTP